MLNIAKIKNGIVIDHIRPGEGIRIYNWLRLDKADCMVAFVSNASSSGESGKKDIIKIDSTVSADLDILGAIDPNITVNIIENEVITKKLKPRLPERIDDVLRCKNPRCISTTERAVTHSFALEDGKYRCRYCDEVWSGDL
jgi:aspartate carbamoyltransferase regulatory subunit